MRNLSDDRQEILQVIKKIDQAETVEAATGIYVDYIYKFGFTTFFVSQIVNPLRPNADKAMMLSNWPEELIEERFRGMKILHDPVVRYGMASRFPFSWKDAYEHASRFGRRMMDKARDFDLVEGYTFPMRRPGAPIGGISIGSDMIDVSKEGLADLEIASMHCYARLEALHPPFPYEDFIELSPQETDVLYFAAAGKTAWETGGAMEISEAAVKDALRRAREKLGAVNTLHACTTAISREIILP